MERMIGEGFWYALLFLVGVGGMLARMGLIAKEPEVKWILYKKTALFAFAFYVISVYWGVVEYITFFLLWEFLLLVFAFAYTEAWSNSFVTGRDLLAAKDILAGMGFKVTGLQKFFLEEGGFWTSLKAPALLLHLQGDFSEKPARVWIFPHKRALKEQGKWWIPVLPKGTAVLLREAGKAGDILLFPFAYFPAEGFVYTGREYVGTGMQALERIQPYLVLQAAVAQRYEERLRAREATLQYLLEHLPRWQGWLNITFEDLGSFTYFLVSPEGEKWGIMLGNKNQEKWGKVHTVARLSGVNLLLWEPDDREEGDREETRVQMVVGSKEKLLRVILGEKSPQK